MCLFVCLCVCVRRDKIIFVDCYLKYTGILDMIIRSIYTYCLIIINMTHTWPVALLKMKFAEFSEA